MRLHSVDKNVLITNGPKKNVYLQNWFLLMPHAHHKRELLVVYIKRANVLFLNFFHRAFAVERHKCCVRFYFNGKRKKERTAKQERKKIIHYWKTRLQEKKRKSFLCRLRRFADFHNIFWVFLSVSFAAFSAAFALTNCLCSFLISNFSIFLTIFSF